MSLNSRRELLNQAVPRYMDATWKEKGRILDEFVAATGFARKYVVAILNRGFRLGKTERRRRECQPRRYDEPIREALITVWKAANRICAKRLIPYLPEFIAALERFGHLGLPEEVRAGLLSMSPATADRLLRRQRIAEGRSISTTRPGNLLKHQIPIRTFADWSEQAPGFMEADLVAHCGDRADGAFLHTLVLTDIATGWTECLALLRRGEAEVIGAMEASRRCLPFPLLGLDTDNGGEFINYELVHYCKQQKITFTRSRSYRKNDQAHVEEKNGSVVRRLVGYDRYEGIGAWRALTALYEVLRLYINFYQPSMKLLSKERIGSRIIKRYDRAQTPYARVLAASSIAEDCRTRLREVHQHLDPLALLKELECLQDKFWEHAHRKRDFLSSTTATAEAISQQPHTGNPAIPIAFVSGVPATSAAAAASPPSAARTYRKTKRPPVPRTWRTRVDPFVDVWGQLQLQLRIDPSRTAKELLIELQERYPGKFADGQRRTLQRRVQQWRFAQFYAAWTNSRGTGADISAQVQEGVDL
jgi:hypothetical protein